MLYNEGRSKVSLKYWVRSNVDAAAFANTTPHIVRYPQMARPAGAAIPLNVTPCLCLLFIACFELPAIYRVVWVWFLKAGFLCPSVLVEGRDFPKCLMSFS